MSSQTVKVYTIYQPDSGNELRSPQSIMGMVLQSGARLAGALGRTRW